MKMRLVKRIFCVFLSLCMLSSFAFALTFGTNRQNSVIDIARGAALYQSVWEDSGSRLSENYIEYSPNAAHHPVVAYGSKLYGTSTYKTAASYLESQGKTVTAVINGDYFNTTSGLPNGIVITDGIVRGSDGYQYAVGFKADGSVIIGKPSMAMSFASSAFSGSITAVNRALSSAGIFLYTSDFSATTRSDLKAVYVIMRPSAQLTMQCTVSAVVEEVKTASSPISIPEGCMMLAATANNSNYSSLSAMAAGQTVNVSVSSAAGWQDVMWAVGAKELLVENGRAVSGLANSTAPRTAVGIKADGTAIFYTVDGRQEDHSAGSGLADLAKRLAELGCVSAVNLDGGGSTAMGIVLPGTDELQTVNSPSDGSLRKCANFIFLVNDAPATGYAQQLHIYPSSETVLAGSKVTFTAGATDANGHYAACGSVNYSSSSGAVSADGVWTAPSAPGVYTVNASTMGLSASAAVEVISSADKVSIYRSSTRVTGKKLTLAPGSVTDFSAKAWYLARQLGCDDSLLAWEVSGNIGSVSPDGVFTATNIETGAGGTLTLTSGSAKATVTINISGSCAVLEDFESASVFIEGESAALESCTDLTKVRYGSASGALSYSPAPDGASSSFVKVSLPLSGDLDWLCGWVKGDGSGAVLSAKFDDESELGALCTLASAEWTFFAVELPANASALSELHITSSGKRSGTVWLDTVYQSKTDTCDTFAPTIDIDSTDPTRAVIFDGAQAIPAGNISVKYDLAIIPFSYNTVSGALSMELPQLSEGNHLLTVTACDAYGNMNTKTVVLSGGVTLDPFADTEGHWAKTMIAYLYERGIVTGSTKGGKYVFRPDDKITRQEFAAIVCRWMGVDTSDYADVVLPFEDVKSIDSWALPYVKAMYALGISTGSLEYGHLIFAPTAYLTRAQAMAMLGRTQPMGYETAELTFADKADIPSWALPFISPLALRGVVNGSGGKLNPSSDVTRAEVAKMIYSMS